MLHSGEWLVKKYASLAQPKANQTLDTTLITLSSRLQEVSASKEKLADGSPAAPPLPPLPDRRAAVLTLKGLARDHPVEVGNKALDAILESLCRDAKEDDEIARAVVETCLTLCESNTASAGQGAGIAAIKDHKLPPYAFQHVDKFLATPGPLHALLPLLSPSRSFYTRFSSLQLLGLLLRIRSERVQEHVLTSPGGCGAILECLSEGSGSSAEIVRNEALLLLPRLVDANADIQKLIAFEGAFEKLIDVVALEGRIEGGVVVQDALDALVALLKYNVSNQNYFRETLSVPLLAPLLFYPPPPPADNPQAQAEYANQLEAFAFQQWYPPLPPSEDDDERGNNGLPETDEQKVVNAGLVLEVAGLLVEGQGDSKRMNQNALLSCGFTKCLIELSMSSTAPTGLKSQALHVLASLLRSNRSNQDLLNTLEVSPIISIGGQKGSVNDSSVNYTRLPPRPAILELIGAAVNGTTSTGNALDALAFRASALDCFDAYVNDNLDARLNILKTMADTEESQDGQPSSGTGPLLLRGLAQFPESSKVGQGATYFDAYRYLISALLFAHLVRGSDTAKDMARGLLFGADGKVVDHIDVKKTTLDEDDERSTLIQLIIGNLTMALREHGEATRRERGAGVSASKSQIHGQSGSPTDWARIQIGYLIVLITWIWESPAAVAELLKESSNLQILIQPVNQGGNMIDPIVSGLCAVALGIAYEYAPTGDGKEDEGSVTRKSMHPILHSRIGPDQFAARLNRLRDDGRFKNTSPDVLDNLGRQNIVNAIGPGAPAAQAEEEEGLWFDWAFVDFIKTNYVLIQKSILVDPSSSSANQASQSTELLDAKRQLEQLQEQQAKLARESEHLSQKLKEAEQLLVTERESSSKQVQSIQAQNEKLQADFKLLKDSTALSDEKRATETSASTTQLTTLQEQVSKLEESNTKETQQRNELENKLKLIQQEKDGMAKRLQDALKSSEEAEAKIKAAQAEAETAKAEVEKAKEEAAKVANGSAAKATAAAAPNGENEDGEKSKEELEKELEDLLILLDELSTKRKNDKKRMRQKGMDVSEDEEDDDDDDEDTDDV
ncbi:uncharacterized protein FA14DRAFT_159287, partial [Meira miltonrushii]